MCKRVCGKMCRRGDMTVYIEYVIIDNFVIDYMLLKLSLALVGKNVSKKRLALGATIGTIFALLMPLINVNNILLVIVKFFVGSMMVVVASCYKSLNNYLATLAIFMLLTFCVGGAVIGVYNVLGVNYSSEVSIATMFLPCYLAIKLVRESVKVLKQKRQIESFSYRFKVYAFGRAEKGVGFMDSGNMVYDGINPVVFCSKEFAQKFLDCKGFRFSKSIRIDTVNGASYKKCFKTEKIVLYFKDKPNIYNNVTVCISESIKKDAYDIILHPALIGEEYDREDNAIIKEAN